MEGREGLQRSLAVDAGPLPPFGHCGFLRGGEGGNLLKGRHGRPSGPAKPGSSDVVLAGRHPGS